VRFFSATFGAGVVAPQHPITCPKRQLQPERYATFEELKMLNGLQNWLDYPDFEAVKYLFFFLNYA
jgi:hypothetical protein